MMTVYLDNSFLNRPFDNPDIGTNKLESEILSLVIKLADKGKIELVNSSVIVYENSLNPLPERKIFVKEVLKRARFYQNINEDIKKEAENLVNAAKVSSVDALHLASAEKANANIFITCDYDIIKKYKGKVKVITPLEFLKYYEHANI